MEGSDLSKVGSIWVGEEEDGRVIYKMEGRET